MSSKYISSFKSHNVYFSGADLSNLELRVKGEITYEERSTIALYDRGGNFYKNESIYTRTEEVGDIAVPRHFGQGEALIQVDYKFYLVPIMERISVQSGRQRLATLLHAWGVKLADHWLRISTEFVGGREVWDVNKPCECVFQSTYRINTKSFRAFDFKDYEREYSSFVKKHPDYEREARYLYLTNLNLIAGFYRVRTEEIKKPFDRVKFAVKALNHKILENIKYNNL